MTWLERLYENNENIYKFHLQYAESYLPSFNKFTSCVDEFQIFEELGLKHHTDCPCCDKVPDIEDGYCDCLLCELHFLTDPEIYEKSISEVDENG